MVGGVLTDTPLQLITTYEKTAISVRSFRHRFRTGNLRINRGELLLISVYLEMLFGIPIHIIVAIIFAVLVVVAYIRK